jgi:hypothetical protein
MGIATFRSRKWGPAQTTRDLRNTCDSGGWSSPRRWKYRIQSKVMKMPAKLTVKKRNADGARRSERPAAAVRKT